MKLFHLAIAIAMVAAVTTAATAQNQNAATNVSPAQATIDRAAAANKYVFLFCWKERDQKTDAAKAAFDQATAKYAASADVALVQINDAAEKAIVDKYGLSRAPMPLVLSIAPCGAITKAFTKAVDETQIRTAFVSACTQQCLKGLQDRKLVFVCVVDKADPNAPLTVPKGVGDFKADQKYGPATEIVLVDAQDKGEATFLKELDVAPAVAKPMVVFLAPPGALVGRFGDVSKDVLVAQLVAAQSNPCAGGKCGPGGCGPKKK